MKFYDIEQNSEEWDLLRLGKFTASSFSDLFMSKDTKGYKDEITRVAMEILTGESQEKYSNGWMKYGHEKEPLACDHYETMTFETLENGGFYELNKYVGASPDRKIVGKNGGIEIKCRSFSVYREYIETGKVPKSNIWQVHGQMLCTGWDFIDYMPYLSPNVVTKILRVERDESILNMLKEKLDECILEVETLINKFKI